MQLQEVETEKRSELTQAEQIYGEGSAQWGEKLAQYRSSALALQYRTQRLEQYLLMDDAELGIDRQELYQWTLGAHNTEARLRSIDHLLWAEDAAAAAQDLAALTSEGSAGFPSPGQQTDPATSNIQVLKQLEIDLITDNRDYEELTSAEEQTLFQLANQPPTDRAVIQAQNLLHLLGQAEYQAEAYWGDPKADDGREKS
ncbi:MAG: hypothetical protein AAF840_17385, partial [Bacteroidota bacterium]